jgi:hypothetical protein
MKNLFMHNLSFMKTLLLTVLSILLFLNFSFSQEKIDSTVKPEESTFYDGPSNTVFAPGFLLKTRSKNFYEITGKLKQPNVVPNPAVKVYKDKRKYKLVIDGIDQAIPAVKVQDIVESNIDGTFRGWDGSTAFKLMNGDVWVQDEVKTLFSPTTFNPAVYIYTGSDGSYKMKVAGVNETLQVKKK